MRKKLLSILALLCLTVSGAWAEVTGSLSGGTLTISGTGAIAEFAWISNSDITSIVIENGVTNIGRYAFAGCSSLTSVTIPNSVTSIEEGAFAGCSSLTSVTIPNSVTSIGDGAFAQTDLTSVTIPNSVTSIGDQPFIACTSLTVISVDAENPNYCSESGVLFNKDKTSLIQYPVGKTENSYVIPNSVTSIGQNAFTYSKLASVTIGNNVTSIGENAFSYSSSLESVTIPNSVETIGVSAFYGCSGLTSVTLNSNPFIGDDAFTGIKAGATVTMNLTANPAGGAYWMTFYNENYSFTPDVSTKVYKGAVSGDNLELTEVAAIPKNNAAILKSSNATITMTLDESASADFTGNILQGSSVEMATPANCYTLSCGASGTGALGFYKYSGTTLNYGKAYLINPAGARDFIGFDEATGINSATLTNSEKVNNEVYDLQGRRVQNPTKGLYIVSGKKVVIK